jgi:hypothetical protein
MLDISKLRIPQLKVELQFGEKSFNSCNYILPATPKDKNLKA